MIEGMRVLLNIIWLIFGGVLLALGYAIATGPERGVWRVSLDGGSRSRMVGPEYEQVWSFDASPEDGTILFTAGRTVGNLSVITDYR